MAEPLIAVAFGLTLVIIHYLSDRFHVSTFFDQVKTTSFTAGIFLTYIILHLFPQIYIGNIFLTRTSLIFVLLGFTIFHLVEKYIYKHSKSVDELKDELHKQHSVSFFLYHFVLGIVLVNLSTNLINGILFFIPILSYTALSSISLKEIHGKVKDRRLLKIVLSSSTFLGILFGLVYQLDILTYSSIIGLVAGSLLFMAAIDLLPKRSDGAPKYFILGLMFYTLLIFATGF
jgi:hypothetical protein